MIDSPQKRALLNYRGRLTERGMARFEVQALDSDKELIRSLAKRLAQGDSDSALIRATIKSTIGGDAPRKGGILAALRRSPLAGADIDLSRPHVKPRKVDL